MSPLYENVYYTHARFIGIAMRKRALDPFNCGHAKLHITIIHFELRQYVSVASGHCYAYTIHKLNTKSYQQMCVTEQHDLFGVRKSILSSCTTY